jgi:hypothetical protein
MNERSFIVKPHSQSSGERRRPACCRRQPGDDIPWVVARCGIERSQKFSASCRKGQVRHGESVPWRTGSLCSPARCPHASSGLIQRCFHGVLRHDRHRLRRRDQSFIRNRRRLPDKLPDRSDCTQDAQRVDHRFHNAPSLLFRVDQERVCRLSFVLHNFKTPRSCRFV